MRLLVTIVYNEPDKGRYFALGESKAELDVLDEVTAVEKALRELGHDVILLPLRPPVKEAAKNIREIKSDLIFNLFEGFSHSPESEAEITRIITETGLSHTGCPASAIALAQNKEKALLFLKKAGITVPECQVISPDKLGEFRLELPCIVKPVGEHASHGLSSESVVRDTAALEKQVRRISELYGGCALVEEFIDGQEFNIAVVGNKELMTLQPSEIVFDLPPGSPKILTFAAKWEDDSVDCIGTRVVCPAPVPQEKREDIARIARKVFVLFGCRGYARVDMRDKAGELHVIDVNPNTDVSPDTGTIIQAEATGFTYTGFIEKIVQLAMEKD